MHFTEIRLTNFGQYNGEHIIDLRPNVVDGGANDRPIVLIGGKNGAGKTTILEAVKLCLYGSAALGAGVRRQEYEAYLLSRIHRQIGAPLNNTFAGVGVSFVHTMAGVTQTFDVWRVWQRKRRGVEEVREVRRDGKLLEEHEYAGWEQFLHDLLPPGLANLFFFDGEQIQALAGDTDSIVLGSSIRALLGLDLLVRLKGDLAVYVARQKRTGDISIEEQLDALKAEREQIEEGFGEAYAKLNTITTEISRRKGKIEDQERLLASEGGTIAARRDTLRQRAEVLRADLRRYERMIGEHAAGLLPFAVVPALSTALRERLIQEEQIEQRRTVRSITESFTQALLGRLIQDKQWLGGVIVPPRHLPYLVAGLTNTITEVATELSGPDNGTADHKQLHDLSKSERQEIISWLDQSMRSTPQALQELAGVIEAATTELSQIETTLQNMPAEETIQPILNRLAALQREVGALEEQEKQQNASVQQWRQKRADLDRREQELYTRLMRGDDPTYRLRLAGRAQQALKRYEEALQQAKIQELEQKIVECFGRLSRKGNYIRRISIDPKTFATTLYNHKGDDLPKEQLSAGEKQIYAVAVLWALRLVSRRSLPIIVDTPLGRLDSEHRQRLVQRYFPQASHQVLLLSTDTEIDEELYEDLEPAVTRTYRRLPADRCKHADYGGVFLGRPSPPNPLSHCDRRGGARRGDLIAYRDERRRGTRGYFDAAPARARGRCDVAMKLTRVRFCDEADQRLQHLKARTTLTANLLCRVGFCLSLDDPTIPDPAKYPEDSPREIDRPTLTGQYDALFLALLRERCVKDGLPTSGKDFEDQFRAHMNRGVLMLFQRVKTLADLCKLGAVAAVPGAPATNGLEHYHETLSLAAEAEE